MKWPVVFMITLIASRPALREMVGPGGDQGHKVICEIAIRLVQPNTRAEIEKLISTDERFSSFNEPARGRIIHGKGPASIS